VWRPQKGDCRSPAWMHTEIMKTWLRRVIAPAIALLVVAAIGVPAFAGTSPGGSTFLDEVAHRLGIAPSKLKKAIDDTAAARASEHRGAPVFRQGRFGDRGHEQGWGHDERSERRHRGGVRAVFNAAARYLGLSERTLWADLRSGKTLAQVADERHLPVDGLESAILDVVRTKLRQAVAGGRLTEVRAQQIEAVVATRIHEFVQHGFGRRHLG
jgi:hypothetical protein